jgi:hypothetical protein
MRPFPFFCDLQLVGLRQFDEVLYVIPVGQSHGQNQLFAFFRGQRLQSGNASGKAGLIHGIRIQPDESADKRDQDQPGILADPFLPFILAQLWSD